MKVEASVQLSAFECGTMEDYPCMLLTCREIGPGKIFMMKDTNTQRVNIKAEIS